MKFEWDQNKDRANRRKHGVSFEEAMSVFYKDEREEYWRKRKI